MYIYNIIYTYIYTSNFTNFKISVWQIPVAVNTVLRLLMMDSKSVRNIWSCVSKQSWEIAHLVGFYYRNVSWCTVLRMSYYIYLLTEAGCTEIYSIRSFGTPNCTNWTDVCFRLRFLYRYLLVSISAFNVQNVFLYFAIPKSTARFTPAACHHYTRQTDGVKPLNNQ